MEQVTSFIRRKSNTIEWALRLLAAGGPILLAVLLLWLKSELAETFVTKTELVTFDQVLQLKREKEHEAMIASRQQQFAEMNTRLSLMQQTLLRVERKLDPN